MSDRSRNPACLRARHWILRRDQQPVWIRVIRIKLAERTGLEPATSGVTGRRSNRLNYRSNRIPKSFRKCGRVEHCSAVATGFWVE